MRKANRGLIMAMALSMMLCGCGGDSPEGNSDSQGNSGAQENSGAQDDSGSGASSGQEEYGFPISEEMIDVTGMAWVSPQGGDNTDNYGWDRYREMTNINVQWENVPNDILEERKSTVMTSNSLPDVFFALGFSNSDLTRYGNQGVFLALDDLIDQYGHNFRKLMEEYPEIRRGITMPDGHIYGMPTSPQYKEMLAYLNMLYTEKLLDNEVYSMPSSRDMVAKLTQNIVGVHADYTTNAGELQDKFLAMPVFENYYGNKVWNRVLPLVETPGAFVISAGCKYPGEMMRWIDYFYGEEGQLMSNMGFEGVTFEYDENGEVKYTDEKTAAFITGRESLDNWDKYVKEFERLNLSRYVELVEAGYTRYSSN